MEVKETPVLKRVVRLDSLPLNQTFFTSEGYLIDRPIVTSCGIFEYRNEDGSIRRELRLPEDVFDAESLASYKSKPVIVTHDAGLITSKNVEENIIGTILSEGYRSGNDVRCEIVIHDTDEMKRCGYKELSLGYNLDLDETPGVWNGQHYDARQKSIRINHLALVQEARAGDQARLNIDSRDKQTPKGVKVMAKTKKTSRADSVLSPEEFNQAIEEYKARRAERVKAQKDAEEEKEVPVAAKEAPVLPEKEMPEETEKEVEKDADEEEEVAAEVAEEEVPAKAREYLKPEEEEKAVEADEEEDPKKVMAQMDEDMSVLFDIIDTLLAEREFKEQKPEEAAADEMDDPLNSLDKLSKDCDDSKKMDSDDEEEMFEEEEFEEGELEEDSEDEELEKFEEDEDEEEEEEELFAKKNLMNADSVDKMIRERIKIGVIGEKLNLDGVDAMPVKKAKKAIIKAVRPNIRLDGKSDTYVNHLFDMACAEAKSYKSTAYQKRQMFNSNKRMDSARDNNSSEAARQRMIQRLNKNKED